MRSTCSMYSVIRWRKLRGSLKAMGMVILDSSWKEPAKTRHRGTVPRNPSPRPPRSEHGEDARLARQEKGSQPRGDPACSPARSAALHAGHRQGRAGRREAPTAGGGAEGGRLETGHHGRSACAPALWSRGPFLGARPTDALANTQQTSDGDRRPEGTAPRGDRRPKQWLYVAVAPRSETEAEKPLVRLKKEGGDDTRSPHEAREDRPRRVEMVSSRGRASAARGQGQEGKFLEPQPRDLGLRF